MTTRVFNTSIDPFQYRNYRTFDFETNFNYEEKIAWFEENWTHAFLYSALYLGFVFGGPAYMQTRPKYDLRSALTIWSITLAVFSSMGAVRLWQEYTYIVTKYGWKASMCDPIFYTGISGFWAWAFIVSKLPELGDTVFIILRKQRLIFLHWYHHVTVLIYAWYSYAHFIAQGRYFLTMNYTVHAVMYLYYGCRASGMFKIPLYVNISITALQVIQMVIACVVNLYAHFYRNHGEYCSTTDAHTYISLALYMSYFVLFANFFYHTYYAGKVKGHGKRKAT
ncbi:very long chain fatty acid elongase 6-like [Saccoglossus kowalevskii]|uniref:Elongation of very long chain fatty acids protein n=1 Tax=Saccoglossus kowalevskii TaxID=10224 RepID=A0ABM0GRZ7_SACKO|nr:PREDICTED: elongation of very long chain fatty acids protein 6-like [Saccoglossus kowalevskii]